MFLIAVTETHLIMQRVTYIEIETDRLISERGRGAIEGPEAVFTPDNTNFIIGSRQSGRIERTLSTWWEFPFAFIFHCNEIRFQFSKQELIFWLNLSRLFFQNEITVSRKFINTSQLIWITLVWIHRFEFKFLPLLTSFEIWWFRKCRYFQNIFQIHKAHTYIYADAKLTVFYGYIHMSIY